MPQPAAPASSPVAPACALKKGRKPLSPDMAGMAAVTEQRERLHRMTRTFTQRVGSFLVAEFGAIADSTLNRVSPSGGARHRFRETHQNGTRTREFRIKRRSWSSGSGCSA